MRNARTVQHLLPIILLALGFVELSAIIPVAFDPLDVGGTAAMLGPSAFLPVSLGVVWAALLPPTGFALAIKAVTAVGAAAFTAIRGVLIGVWWRDSDALGWSTGGLVLAGFLLGLTLAAWAFVDARATRESLRTAPGVPVPAAPARPAAPLTVRTADAVPPSSPTTPTRPTSPASALVGGGAPVPVQQQAAWQSVSTPWPRRDEADPDGTVIRPPRRNR
ncbi:MAG: hypothetical protein ABIS84_08365 [Arachnia sp.]